MDLNSTSLDPVVLLVGFPDQQQQQHLGTPLTGPISSSGGRAAVCVFNKPRRGPTCTLKVKSHSLG